MTMFFPFECFIDYLPSLLIFKRQVERSYRKYYTKNKVDIINKKIFDKCYGPGRGHKENRTVLVYIYKNRGW